jgi:hypothetical protein
VIHPLSQEYIKKGFPIPKGTPKFVMDKVETMAAHMPPMVYCKMENIISPTGAEAEGWLISVGGTPKEMLARSPEFTYRRLLHAAKIAEKMGAQIMGLGAFTKVVGDAGVTVARRVPACPSPRATAIRPLARCGPPPTPCAAWGWSRSTPSPKGGRQDHGDRRLGLDRLGQRALAGHGLRRGLLAGRTLSKLEANCATRSSKKRRTPRSSPPPTTTSCWATWT